MPEESFQQQEGADYTARMAQEHANDEGNLSSPLACLADDERDVTASSVSFSRYQGYLATPTANAADNTDTTTTTTTTTITINALPCLIVIHEWWGLNPQIQAVTRKLAGQGYRALAVNLYGQTAATDVKTARAYMKACFQAKDEYCMDCLKEAVAYLQSTAQESPRIGVIGWSMIVIASWSTIAISTTCG